MIKSSFLKNIVDLIDKHKGILSLMSFVLCGLAYLYQVLNLKKWEIPFGIIDSMKLQFLFTVIVGILYCLSTTLLQEYMRSKLSILAPNHKAYKTIKKWYNRLNKDESVKQSLNIEEVKKSCKSIDRFIVISIIRIFFVGIILYLPFYMLFFIIVLDATIPFVFILFSITVLIMIVMMYHLCNIGINQLLKEKKQLIKNKPYPETYTRSCCDINDYVNKHSKLNSQALNDLAFNYTAIPISATFLFIISIFLHLCSNPSNYYIYTDEDNNTYASILFYDDNLILKRAYIDNDTISIDINDQYNTNNTNRPLKLIHFKKVNIINDNK